MEAARDLSVDVRAPYLVELPDGTTKHFLALVKGFGASKGMLVGTLCDSDLDASHEDSAIAERFGFGFSELNPESYGTYDREFFVNTLLDWGWADPKREPPDWYQLRTSK